MASLYELTKPIQKDQLKELQEPLEYLQGNILRAHGRDHAVHVFLHFKDNKQTEVKQWINELAEHITSAQQQLDEIEPYRQYGIPGRLFMSFFLSAQGYKYLGFNWRNILLADVENRKAFWFGMKGAQKRLNDPPVKTWEEKYWKDDIHAMVMLADDDAFFLLREVRKLLDDVKAHAEICTVEHGKVMRNAQGNTIEHFGYADGKSQPLFFQSDIAREKQEAEGQHVWDPGAGPNLVLVPDPYGRKGSGRNGRDIKYYDSGSYLVFRKFEQNVRAFKEQQQQLAHALGGTAEGAERAGALAVGRFKDGTPIVLQRTAGLYAPVPNNFTYGTDPHGQKCPFQAHIRKVNSRKEEDKHHRIVRRGIPYGKREKEPKDNPSFDELPSEGVGLLFMCYQSSIVEQFEFVQSQWANEPNFPEKGTGIDPIMGQRGQRYKIELGHQKWPVRWNEPQGKHTPFDFYNGADAARQFVTFKGGEYFFAPSIFFLRNVGTRKASTL
jgi:Dyp-type peroxidase family